jgi:acyl-CoA thioester hydrolase
MPRVDLDLPERFAFETRIPIRIGDINYGGHLGNEAVLAIAQEARVRWLATVGLTELDVGGVGLVMADAVVVYRSEGRYGMVLEVALAADDVRSRSFDLLYRLADQATGAEIARVKTGLLCFDYAARRLARMPSALREALAASGPG